MDSALQDDGASGPPRVVLTFDDAYAGAVELALPELRRRGLPATVFIAPGLLGCAETWWDALAPAWLADPGSAFRERCLATGARIEDVRAMAMAAGVPWHPVRPEHAIATETQLRAACYPGLTLGAHTWNHVNLAAWRAEWHEPELEAPLRWLQRAFPDAARPWLALPFGLASPPALEAVRVAGYARCFRVEGGWRRPGTDALQEPRLNVPAGATAPRLRYAMVSAPA